MNAEELIDAVLEGCDVEDLLDEEMRRVSTRPRRRRFGRRGAGVNPLTGKRKDPRRRMVARRSARKGRAKRKASMRKFHRSAAGKRFHKKLGKLSARIRRR